MDWGIAHELSRTVSLVAYWSAAVGLTAFGLYYLVIGALRLTLVVPPSPADSGRRPKVTVQVPLRNEAFVASRVLAACSRLDWPPDRLEMQVLDDSDDETTEVARQAVSRMRAIGLDAILIHREDAAGYKPGALNRALATSQGEFVVVFDADFVPPPDFLRAALAPMSDPEVACVSFRWTHLNEPYSWLTRSLGLALDAHFTVEQEVRSRYGLILSFNATACAWRRSALEAAGGWPEATLTEDLDLTLRVMMDGGRLLYRDSPSVPCEIPVEILGFARQQERWAHGSAHNLRLHAPRLARSPQLSGVQRIDAAFHLAHYGFQPLLLLLFLASLGLLATGAYPSRPWAAALGVVAAAGPTLLLVQGHARTRRGIRPVRLVWLVPLSLVGLGICLRVTIAFARGLAQRPGRFRRTPKYRIAGSQGSWRGTRYVPRPDGITWLEVVLGVVAVAGAAAALALGRLALAASLAAFAVAFLLVGLGSLAEQGAAPS